MNSYKRLHAGPEAPGSIMWAHTNRAALIRVGASGTHRPAIEFRALTPRREWHLATRGDVLDVLHTWFGDCDIQDVLRVDTSEIGARHHVAYRYQGERTDGPFVIEQQAYYDETGGQISWVRLLCSGFQPR